MIASKLQGRDFLKLLDYTPEEIEYLIDLAGKLKVEKKTGYTPQASRRQKYSVNF